MADHEREQRLGVLNTRTDRHRHGEDVVHQQRRRDGEARVGPQVDGGDLEVAAAGNTEVVRSKLKTMRALSLNDSIEDMLITLGKAYHIIRPMAHKEGVFLYAVFDRNRANLALARRKIQDVEKALDF